MRGGRDKQHKDNNQYFTIDAHKLTQNTTHTRINLFRMFI